MLSYISLHREISGLLFYLPCFLIVAHCSQKGEIIPSHDLCVGVIWSQLLLTDGQCSLQQWLCLGILPLAHIEASQIIEAGRGVGVVWSQLLLSDSQCSLIQWLGLGVLPLTLIESSQIVEA